MDGNDPFIIHQSTPTNRLPHPSVGAKELSKVHFVLYFFQTTTNLQEYYQCIDVSAHLSGFLRTYTPEQTLYS